MNSLPSNNLGEQQDFPPSPPAYNLTNDVLKLINKTETIYDSDNDRTDNREDVITGKISKSLFYNFPASQVFIPNIPYPLWDRNWDFRTVEPKEKEKIQKLNAVVKPPPKITRHVILIRHGQYDESSRLDEERILTELGRKQAKSTGVRLRKILEHVDDKGKDDNRLVGLI